MRKISIIHFTPEHIPAAFARISRSDKPIEQLVEEAAFDIIKSRQSNQKIIFEFGHHSVAEMATYAIGISGVSRLAAELIQRHRLNSYLEKSQRYILLQDGYVLPEEIVETGLKDKFRLLMEKEFEAYNKIYLILKDYFKNKYPTTKEKELENLAKEDARYVLGLATTCQFVIVLNARNLEHLIMSLNACPVQEVRYIAQELATLAHEKTPSLIKYLDPTPYVKYAKDEITNYIFSNTNLSFSNGEYKDVELIYHTKNPDERLVASLLFATGFSNMKRCKMLASKMTRLEKEKLILTSLRDINIHDTMMREYEYIDFVYELFISASCYAQLKRHRMTTQTTLDYNLDYYTIPKSIIEAGCLDLFLNTVSQAQEFNEQIPHNISPTVNNYCALNATKRKVLLKTNLRELFHISKLREDKHAQWDIRNIVNQMVQIAKKKAPASTISIGGKEK